MSARSGGIILVGLSPFVRQVLELAGLLEQFHSVISLEEALGAAKRTSAAHHVQSDHVVSGRHYTTRTISAEQATLELWGSIPVTADKVCLAENLVAVSLGELGPAIGIGGFGQNSTHAVEALGEFVAAGCLAGVIPADGQCISDFILTDAPAEATVYVASAMGLAGKPVLLVEGDQGTTLSMAQLINDIFPMVTELRGKRPSVLGVSAEEETLHCEELDIVLPNPFHFLKYSYPQRKGYSRLWYTAINHGDLNMQNILLDERENIYVIDFSETRPRNIVSDFARLEAIVKIEMTRLNDEEDLRALLEFEMALTEMSLLGETPPCNYRGSDMMVAKAHSIICLLRDYANRVTIFETDIIPYLLALLEWTYPVVCYGTASFRAKRFAALSAGMMVRKILEMEASDPALLQSGDVNP